jgi:hypothetical protein
MAREKTTGFFFKMSPKESELFERRMAQTGIKNKSAFIRKMCIDGHVFNLELSEISEIKRLLSIIANNGNQIAKRVNSGGEARREDIAEMNGQITEARLELGKVLALLTNVADAKPGERFIRPPTIRDLPEYYEQPTQSEGI